MEFRRGAAITTHRATLGRISARVGAVMLGLALVVVAPRPAVAAPVAGGTAPAIHVDPNSPAGHEYAIPLGQARGVSGTAGLFGGGITKPPDRGAGARTRAAAPGPGHSGATTAPGATTAAQTRPGASGAVRRRGSGAVRRTSRRDLTTRPAASATQSGSPSGGPGGLVWMLGAGGLVLVVGALGGEALTRGLRRIGARGGEA